MGSPHYAKSEHGKKVRRDYMRRYRKTAQYKSALAAYRKTSRGKEVHRGAVIRYSKTAKGLATLRRVRNSPRGKFRMYAGAADKRGLRFSLSFLAFMTFWNRPCNYCGSAIETVGLDRVDSAVGYIFSNLVPCCWVCNRMKGEMSTAAFIEQCRKVSRK